MALRPMRGCSRLADSAVPITVTAPYAAAACTDECNQDHTGGLAGEPYFEFFDVAANWLQMISTFAVDASHDWRSDFTVPPNPPTAAVFQRPFATPIYLTWFSSGSVAAQTNNTDASVSQATASAATLAGQGFPAVGQRVQIKVVWNAVTDVLSWHWRDSHHDLRLDDTGWTQAATSTNAGKVILNTTSQNVMGGSTVDVFLGKIYRFVRFINGVCDADVRASDPPNTTVSSFTPTTGPAVSIQRNPALVEVILPGTSGNFLTAPDAAALDILGDITLAARVALDDWTPSARQDIVAKWGAAGQRSYLLGITATGLITLLASVDGTANIAPTSTVPVPVADGAYKCIAATLDVDDGAGNRVARFWTCDDMATWVQLGATVTTAGVTSIFNSTALLEIGSNNGGSNNRMVGKVSDVWVRSGIGAGGIPSSTEVFRLDELSSAASEAATTMTATTGQVVTVNRSGSPDTDIVLDANETLLVQPTFAGVGCASQAPAASGPAERLSDVEPCAVGVC